MQLVKSSRLPAAWVLPFMLGADIGITTSVQLIALHFYDFYPVFLVAGLIGFQFCRRELVRGIGQIVLGLGFIYLAMSIMGGAARSLPADSGLAVWFSVLPRHRLLLVLFAAVLTFVMQSSTATIGLALAFAETGGTTLNLMLPVVLGANLGIGLISVAVGLPTAAGRQLAAGNLLSKRSPSPRRSFSSGPCSAFGRSRRAESHGSRRIFTRDSTWRSPLPEFS